MFFDQLDRHQQMSRLDPRDTNGDGVVSPEEAAAYVRDYLNSASPAEREALMRDYFNQMTPDQRQQVGEAIVNSPANPVQRFDYNDPNAFGQAYTQAAQAPVQNGQSPLEAAFNPGGALSNPLLKAGLVGLAGMIGSAMLRRR